MAIDFPSTPSLNETYTYGSRTWVWNGTAWQQTSTTYGPTGPAGPTGPTGPTGSKWSEYLQALRDLPATFESDGMDTTLPQPPS